MRVEANVLESGTDPGLSVQHQPALMMASRTGSIEVGSRRSEMMRFTFGVGEMCLVPRHVETWLRKDELHYSYLSVDISDTALAAACDGTKGDVEFRRVGKLIDARVGKFGTLLRDEFLTPLRDSVKYGAPLCPCLCGVAPNACLENMSAAWFPASSETFR
jgi:hypothetical protein